MHLCTWHQQLHNKFFQESLEKTQESAQLIQVLHYSIDTVSFISQWAANISIIANDYIPIKPVMKLFRYTALKSVILVINISHSVLMTSRSKVVLTCCELYEVSTYMYMLVVRFECDLWGRDGYRTWRGRRG